MNYVEVKDTVENPVLGFMDKDTALAFFQPIIDLAHALNGIDFVTIGKTMTQNRKLKNDLLLITMSSQFLDLVDTQWVVNKGSYAHYACRSLEAFEQAITEIPAAFAKLEAEKRAKGGQLETPANEQLQALCNRIVENAVDGLEKIVVVAKTSLKIEPQAIAGLSKTAA